MHVARSSGFTLVELLLAVTIVALIAALAWLLLSTTARSVAAQEARAMGPAAAARALDRIAYDLTTLFAHDDDRGCAPLLDEDGSRMSFCAVRAVGRTPDFAWSEPRRIEYRLERDDKNKFALARIEETLSGPIERITNRLLTRVSNFSIELHDGAAWHRVWPPTNTTAPLLPRMAKISIQAAGMADPITSERWIPAGHAFTSRVIRAARAPVTD
jgi:type II secretion system protein J